jgi:hypothetical protein
MACSRCCGSLASFHAFFKALKVQASTSNQWDRCDVHGGGRRLQAKSYSSSSNHCVDHVIDQLRVNHRAIRRDADNHIRFGLFGGLIITVKHIVETAAREGNAAEVAVFGYGVVGRVCRRGEDGFGEVFAREVRTKTRSTSADPRCRRESSQANARRTCVLE